MGSIAVVTTFSQEGYEVYGKDMLRTFDVFWPKEVDLFVYYEGVRPTSPPGRGEWLPLDADPDRKRFMARHKDHPTDYRQQPVKFSHKVWAVTNAAKDAWWLPRIEHDDNAAVYDWLIWLDADVDTVAPVTMNFLDSILPDDVVACYLGRRWWKHTETGFVAYHLNATGLKFLDDLRAVYISGKIMTLHEKHDCAAFDYVRQVYEGEGHKFLDLGQYYQGPSLDVMAASPLASFMRHHKGAARKKRAYGAVA